MPKKKPGPHQTEIRHEDQREEQRGEERADVVEGEDLRDEILELQPILQDAQQQRNLEADERADEQDQRVEQNAKRADMREEPEQHAPRQNRRKAR